MSTAVIIAGYVMVTLALALALRAHRQMKRDVEKMRRDFQREYPRALSEHPYNFDVEKHFPGAKMQVAGECWGAYSAEKNDKFYVIVDEGTLADFLDDGDPMLDRLVRVYVFDNQIAQRAYLKLLTKKRAVV